MVAMADLLRAQLGLRVDMNVSQVADTAVARLGLKLPVTTSLKDKLDAATKSVSGHDA